MADSKAFDDEARQYAESIINTVREPLIVLDQDLRLISANHSFYDVFTIKPEETVGQFIYDMGHKQWGIPELRELLETILPQKTTVQDYKIEHKFADTGKRTMLVNAREIQRKSGKERLILLAIEDITERKRGEQQLLESEEKAREKERNYRLLFEQSPLGVFHTDKSGVIVSCNDNFVKIIGSSQKALVGLDMNTLPDQKIVRELRKAMAGIHGYYEDVYHSVSSKKSTPVRVYFSPLRTEDGTVIGCTGIVEDITEQRQSEQALRQSENYYRAIFETSGSAMFIIEEDSTISHVNSNSEKLLGYTKQEVEGKKSWTEFIHADDVELMKEKHYLCLSTPRAAPLNYESRFFVRNGDLRHGFLTVDMIPDTSQSVISVIDITERKQVEEALQESEQRFRTVLENLSGGIFPHDLDGRFLFVNEAACRNTGYSREELLQMHVADIDPASVEREDHLFWQSLGSGQSISFESTHIKKDGSAYDAEIHLNKINLDGKPAILPIVFDISDRKQAEKEQEKLQAQLNQAQKMETVGRLAGGVAHDFNNMLTIINGYAEMAIDMMDPSDPLRKTIQEIYTAGKKSADIVRQLLAFARKQPISPMLLDLNDTISSMLKMLQRLVGENIGLVWHPGKNLYRVKIDPSQVDQIMANLSLNARDAISDVGKLTIETKNTVVDEDDCKSNQEAIPGRYVMLVVSDDGCGMEKGVKDQLFEPFFTTKEVGKGSGLGLPTVYGIVKQNNGFINVYSEPGEGTIFKIYLPRHEEQEAPASEHLKEFAEQRPTGSETILLVEDDRSVLHMGRVLLGKLGYIVLTAEAPDDALQLAEAYDGKIHLLITDVIMPEMNGRDLAIRINLLRPEIKTIYISSYAKSAIAQLGVFDKGVHYIQKPFSIKDLAVKVREVLEEE